MAFGTTRRLGEEVNAPASHAPTNVAARFADAGAIAPMSIPVGTGIGAINYDASRNLAAIDAMIADPIAGKQWHLGFLGDLATIWRDYSGDGVSFGVYDSGVDIKNSDFDDYDRSKEIRLDGKTYSGDYRPAAGFHGTAVAGLILASADGKNTVGVAFDGTLTSVNIFDPYSGGVTEGGIFVNSFRPELFYRAAAASNQFDIANHSWGTSTSTHYRDYNRLYEGSFADNLVSAVTFAAETGRAGLGTISVKAAGNSGATLDNDPFPRGVDVNSDSVASDRHWVTVGAYRGVDGSAAYYSSRGTALLVSAPSSDAALLGGTGVVTTDVRGYDGYNLTDDPGGKRDFTDSFGGTSAATPMVSGVIGLMLEANQHLGWRDVKDILAASARMPVAFESGPTSLTLGSGQNRTTYNLNEDVFHLTGDSGTVLVNGGGHHYSTDYGYGAVEAFAATRMAEVWNLFGAPKTSQNELHVTASRDFNSVIPDATYRPDFSVATSERVFRVAVKGNLDIEHLDITFSYGSDNQFFAASNNFLITVTSPDGTEYSINTNAIGDSFGEPGAIAREVVGLAGLRGESSQGVWTIAFRDMDPTNVSTLKNLTLDFFGAEGSRDTVHHYTDEVTTMLAIAGQGARGTITDTNGGTDWIDMSAVTASVTLDMARGGNVRFDATDVMKVGQDTAIENVVMGDGFDTVYGNDRGNHILGMRGTDLLYGGRGNDFLVGGQDGDQMYGGSGQDVFYFDLAESNGIDTIFDFSSNDLLAFSSDALAIDGVISLTSGLFAKVLRFNGIEGGDRILFNGSNITTLNFVDDIDGVFYYALSGDTPIVNAIARAGGEVSSVPVSAADANLTPTVDADDYEIIPYPEQTTGAGVNMAAFLADDMDHGLDRMSSMPMPMFDRGDSLSHLMMAMV